MKAALIIAGAGFILLLLALYISHTQANARQRVTNAVIITHALIEWKLAQQQADD